MTKSTKAAPESLVAVLGASPNEARYSFRAVKMLREYGHSPIPVHPTAHKVNGLDGVSSLDKIDGDIDTLTVYINSTRSDLETEKILALKPRRVIFNPGSENATLAQLLAKNGIEVIEACTLVMLRSEQF